VENSDWEEKEKKKDQQKYPLIDLDAKINQEEQKSTEQDKNVNSYNALINRFHI
jgi:hypothetical protein